jgi:hypothetical protein
VLQANCPPAPLAPAPLQLKISVIAGSKSCYQALLKVDRFGQIQVDQLHKRKNLQPQNPQRYLASGRLLLQIHGEAREPVLVWNQAGANGSAKGQTLLGSALPNCCRIEVASLENNNHI